MKKNLLFEKDKYFKERAEASYDIASLIGNNVPYVFVDETTLYLNNLKAKTWQRSDAPIYAPRNSTVINGITVYGAVGPPSVIR